MKQEKMYSYYRVEEDNDEIVCDLIPVKFWRKPSILNCNVREVALHCIKAVVELDTKRYFKLWVLYLR